MDKCRKAYEEMWNSDDPYEKFKAVWNARAKADMSVEDIVAHIREEIKKYSWGSIESSNAQVNISTQDELVFTLAKIVKPLTTCTEAKVSGEVVTREVLFPVFKSLVDRWVEKRDEIHEILSKRMEDRLANFLADNFQLPAPQSPVVPSKDELRAVFIKRGYSQTSFLDELVDDINAHLVANARESREDSDTAILTRERDEARKDRIDAIVQREEWRAKFESEYRKHQETDKELQQLRALATVGKEW